MIYLQLFYEFFKIGLFTFGGGYAMIPLMKQAVLTNAWLLEEEFYSFLGICEATPGPIAVNMATYIGSSQGGILGGICATIGVVLPAFIIILLVATILKKLTKNKYFQAFLDGVKPIVVGLILSTGIVLVCKAIGWNMSTEFDFDTISTITFGILCAGYFILKYACKKKINNIAFIVTSGVVGFVVAICFVGL